MPMAKQTVPTMAAPSVAFGGARALYSSCTVQEGAVLTLAHFGDETREEDELREHEHHRLAREQEACTESDTQALASCCLRGAITPLHTQLQRLESKLVLHVQPKHGLGQHPSLAVLAQPTA